MKQDSTIEDWPIFTATEISLGNWLWKVTPGYILQNSHVKTSFISGKLLQRKMIEAFGAALDIKNFVPSVEVRAVKSHLLLEKQGGLSRVGKQYVIT